MVVAQVPVRVLPEQQRGDGTSCQTDHQFRNYRGLARVHRLTLPIGLARLGGDGIPR